MSTTVDAINIILGVCAVPLAGLISACLIRLRAKLGKEDTAQDKANLEAEVQASIGVGVAVVAQTAPQILKDGITTPQGLQDVANAAALYFRQRFPDRAAQISTAADNGTRDGDVHAAVQQTIAGRLTKVNSGVALVAGLGAMPDGVVISPAPTLAAPLP